MIEELDANEAPGPFDAQLETILADKKNDAYKFLSATFEFLKRKTAFFGEPHGLEATHSMPS